jgi:hypothetical protein
MGYTHDSWGYPRRSGDEILRAGKRDIKIKLERELGFLNPPHRVILLIFPIICIFIFKAIDICFVLSFLPFIFVFISEEYQKHRKPEQSLIMETKRMELSNKIKFEIKKLDDQDLHFSSSELYRLRGLLRESQNFRKDIGDYRIN